MNITGLMYLLVTTEYSYFAILKKACISIISALYLLSILFNISTADKLYPYSPKTNYFVQLKIQIF